MRIAAIFLPFLFAISLFGFELKPQKISDNIYCFIGATDGPSKANKGFVSNVCIVDIGEEVVMLDSGATHKFAKAVDSESQKLFKKPITKVVLTNYHDDRVLGASYFAGREIVAHKSILDDFKSNQDKLARISMSVEPKDYEGTKLIEPNITFEKEYKIEGKKSTIVLLKASLISQAPSDILVYLPKEGVVFAGNILFEERAINYAGDSDAKGWMEAIAKIESLKPKMMVPGHGKPSKNAHLSTKNYLLELDKKIKPIFKNGGDVSEAKKVDFSKFAHMSHFKELHLQNIYNYFLWLETQDLGE